MKEVEVKKHETDFRGILRPTALSVNPGHSEFNLLDEK